MQQGCRPVACSLFHFLIGFQYYDPSMTHFFLYSRSYCHLCDDLLQALQGLKREYEFSVEVLDVDADDALLAKYDELVPVLIAKSAKSGGEEELCHYFLDEPKVRAFLDQEALTDR
jgi:thiol-disulfide isomerase/thioredoxin